MEVDVMSENIREEIRNEIILEMRHHLDETTMSMLKQVLNKTLSNVEIVRIQMLPATTDDVNLKIIELFNMNKAPKLSKKTVNYYLDTINKLICFTNKSLLKINSMDIEMFLDAVSRTNDAISVNNHRRNISAFYTWMRKSHMILENPCESIEPFKEIHKPIDHMLPEEFEQLKSGCKYKRDRAMIEFMRCTAMRVGEIVNVKISDINWKDGKIQIYGCKNRTYRPVCLDSVAVKYITEYIFSRNIPLNSNEYLFISVRNGTDKTNAMTTGGIRGAIKTIKKRSQLDRRVYPHLFRKTTASNIVKRGGSVHDAGEYLGHKDRSTAGQHYAYISESHTIDIFNKYVALV